MKRMTEKISFDTLNKLDASHRHELTLQLDADNRIMWLSSNWEEVAEQGKAGQQLAEPKVLNQPLSRFVSDDETWLYYEACLNLCRKKQQVLIRPYRCDSPTHKRFMELQLTPLDKGWVEMKHFLIRSEAFEYAVYIQDVTHQQSIQPYQFTRCSLCNRLKAQHQDDWQSPESFGTLFLEPVNVIHSVCPDCQKTAWQAST